MKKILCTLLVLIASVVSAYADDGITAQNVTVPKGGTALLEIDLTNEKAYGAFQFDIKLPVGLSATDVLKTNRLTSAEVGDNKFAAKVSLTDETNNVYTVAVYNDNRMEFIGKSGAVVYVTLIENGSNNVGAELEAQLNKVALSDIDAHQTDGANSTFKITISENDGRLKFYETSEVFPTSTFNTTDKYNVTVYRTINKDEWSSIVLPFALSKAQIEAAFGSDVLLYKFSGFDPTIDLDNLVTTGIKLNFSKVTPNALSGMAGGMPYIIKVSKDITEIKADNVKIVASVNPTNVLDSQYDLLTGTFNGTFVKKKIPADGLFLSSNKFWYSTGNTNVKGFRAWFDLDAILDKNLDLARVTMSFEDPTGINEVFVQEDDRYFNLSGQQVKPEKKGLYIQNGKKKIIK